MAVKSVYISEPHLEGDLVRIRDDEHRHLVVARAEVNEVIEIFNGAGNVWVGSIASVERRETLVHVTSNRIVPPDSYELILGQSLIRASAFEFALEKAVETGATRIIPIIASRSNAKDLRRSDRWQKIIVEAAKQSKRYHLPVLQAPVAFDEILRFDAPTRIMFAERDGAALKHAIAGSPALYLIGPEGGWTGTELASAQQSGFSLVRLGSTILRSETTAVVATALIRYELQNLG
jgi:16S rRNA (uracil1498-N3)-methyltransferase